MFIITISHTPQTQPPKGAREREKSHKQVMMKKARNMFSPHRGLFCQTVQTQA